MRKELRERTISGVDVFFSSHQVSASKIEVEVKFSHPAFGEKTSVVEKEISTEKGRKGLWTTVVIQDRRIFLAFPEEAIKRIQQYFSELKWEEEREEREKREAEKRARAKAIADALAKAKETGEKVMVAQYWDVCHDPEAECDIDVITLWALPDGTTEETRNHQY